MITFLAGPIVRRTELKRVAIWVATEQEMVLSGELFQSLVGSLQALQVTVEQRTAKMGDALFVHIIWLNWSDDIPEGEILYYDLLAQGSSFLKGNQDFCYAGESYPSFIVPGELKNILHGSCRKPHADAVKAEWGSSDQLATAAGLVGESITDQDKRPSTLLLTGDQIYADDVGGPMLWHLVPLAKQLTGWNEVMPRRRLPDQYISHIPNDAKPVHEVEPYRRSPEVAWNLNGTWDGFSSGTLKNHLMTFGEYAGMYVTVFGGDGANPVFPDWNQVPRHERSSQYKERYAKELASLNVFATTLADVRRLLANISTYMIFDDHDVTDDWNISKDWWNRVQRSPRTRRVVSNALAAYWAFQGWGNAPDAFSDGFIDKLEEHLNAKRHDGDVAEEFDVLLWSSSPGRWGYDVPTSPAVIAMDTRTCRVLKSHNSPPELMNSAALTWLALEVEKAALSNTTVCLISPTPVLGFRFAEGVQGVALSLSKLISGSLAALDYESWVAGYQALETSLSSVPELKQLVFLSGDVHYSFARTARMHGDIKVIQLTSSPLHNTNPGLEIGDQNVLVKKYNFLASQEKIGDKHVDITGMNNIALVSINRDQGGQIISCRQQLRTRLADGELQTLTYDVLQGS